MTTHDRLRLLGCLALSTGVALSATPLHADGERSPRPQRQAHPSRNAHEGDAQQTAGRARELARAAVDPDATVAANARAVLRAMGPAGLDAMLSVHAREIDHLRRDPRVARDPAIVRVREAIDAVAAQRDASASGLYWYTDLEQAKAAARRTGKPILSLRLLGRLDEEYSCANSRLFRTVLYPDARVSALLRERFVLHWSSERPAPRIRIDMGDGRVIQRTITGNSVHYVLDAQGRPVDAIPGMYAPAELVRVLHESLEGHARCAGRADDARSQIARRGRRDACLAEWHAERVAAAELAWSQTTAEFPALSFRAPGAPADDAPSAVDAAPIAVGKAVMEQSVLRILERRPTTTPPDAPVWAMLARTRVQGARLDARSRAAVALKTGGVTRAPVVERLELLVAEDTARNELQRHRVIHEWLAAAPGVTLDQLNTRVYAEMFLTPRSDPWLGLQADDLYVGLED